MSARKSKSPGPAPKQSSGGPSRSSSIGRGKIKQAKSAEDIPKTVGKPMLGKELSVSSKSRGSSPAEGSRSQPVLPGIRYITEDLIKKITKEDNLEMVTSLNLTLSKEGGKKIKYIENLEGLRRLQVLSLSCNLIEKIEKLEKLNKLRELNLSFNCLTKLDGLEPLVNLQVLNVSNNNLTHIPVWFSKKLKVLRVFRVSKNNLTSLSEVTKLKVLSDLVQLSVSENPLSELPHSRLHLLFHLRSLESLDGQAVTVQERQVAQDRFEQVQVEELEKQLEDRETRYKKLEEDHNKSVHELQQRELTEQEKKKKERVYQEKIKELERELDTKNGLLKNKTTELTKACEKHFYLEQELAFFKIDSKFGSLGQRPETPELDGSGHLDESPYLGRARYKANKYAHEQTLEGSPQQARLHVQEASSLSMSGGLHPDVRDKMNETLDNEIADKQRAIERAQEHLDALQGKLGKTEEQIVTAVHELRRVKELAPYAEHMEQQKQKLRQILANKMQHVNQLRDAASQVEDDMDQTKSNLQQEQTELSHIKGRLQNLDNRHPDYRKTYAEMVDKEQQISESNQMYSDLQQQMEDMLETIATETNEIRQLELQLNEDQITQNEDLREELGGIVGGLQTYLQSMKEQNRKQQNDFNVVITEKDGLQDRVHSLENELSVLNNEAGNYQELQERLAELEDSIQEHREVNDNLQEQLHRSLHQEPKIQDRIEVAETEVKGLRKALKETQKIAEVDRMELKGQLEAEREHAQKAGQRTLDTTDKDIQLKRLNQQLEAAKALNNSLREELEDQREQLQQQLNESVPPQDLRRRLEHLANTLTKGKSEIRPEGRDDFVGQTFRHVQDFVRNKLNASMKEVNELRQRKDNVEAEIGALKDHVKKLQSQQNKASQGRDAGANWAKLEEERKKDAEQIQGLEQEVKSLSKALKDAHTQATQSGSGPQHTRMVYGTDTETEGDSLNTEERCLLDELQRELMDLRNSMKNKETEETQKLIDAKTEAAARDQDLRLREAAFQQEMERQRRELELQRERQEARIQVISEDLTHAHQQADALQQMLDDRTQNLHTQAQNSDMSNEMIAAQEEEIARLYDILERQRGEMDRLNGLMHGMAAQGPNAFGPGYEEEMASLTEEVARLKETLAMQSQYVQSMPTSTTHAQTQAHGSGGNDHQGRQPLPPGVSTGTQQSMPSGPARLYHPSAALPSMRQPVPQAPYRFQQHTLQSHPRGQHAAGLASRDPRGAYGHGSKGGNLQDGRRRQDAVDYTDGQPRYPQGQRGTVDPRHEGPPQDPHYPDTAGRQHTQGHPSHHGQGAASGHQEAPQSVADGGLQATAPLHSTPTNERDRRGTGDQPDGDQFIDHVETQAPRRPYGGTARGPTTYTDRLENKDRSPPRSQFTMGGSKDPVPNVPKNVPPSRPTRVYNAADRGRPTVGGYPGGRGPPRPVGWYHHPPQHEGLPAGVPLVTPDVSPIRPIPVHGSNFVPPNGNTAFRTSIPSSHPFVPPAPVYVQSNQGQPFAPPAGLPMHQSPTMHHPRPMVHPASTPHPVPHGAPEPMFAVPQQPATGAIMAVPVNLTHNAPDPGLGRSSAPTAVLPGPIPQGQGLPMYIPVTPMMPAPTYQDAVTQTTGVKTPAQSQAPTILMPISPIRPTTAKMEPAKKGILRKSESQEDEDDSYLYCNVPEHHELEDFIASLQEKIKELKSLLKQEKLKKVSLADNREERLVRRLIAELEERRGELEGLDLAIERQKKNMNKMKKEERSLLLDKSAAEEELDVLKIKNTRSIKRNKYLDQFDSDSEDDFNYRQAKNKQKNLQNEIECLEKTLSKRKCEQREADKLFKECQSNLREARNQARETVKQYDQASVGLQHTVRDAVEIEKRANDAGVQLLKASDQLSVLKADVQELARKKVKQERLLKDINQIIAKKDTDFRELDSRTKQSAISYQRVQAELTAAQHREKEILERLKESEEVLEKRRQELTRLRDQIENQRAELEKVDQQMGRRKTELHMLEETMERKQAELGAVLRDAEAEVIGKQRELKDCREQWKGLESQNSDLTAAVKVKRAELQQLKCDIEQEEEVLDKIVSAVCKQKAELKHTYEMQKLEQTELESVKSQHSQKLLELEKTQKALLDERVELDQLLVESNRKTGELERLRQSLDRERQDLERIALEKRSIEEQITTMNREREMLDDSSKTVDNKVNQLKRAYMVLEDKTEQGTRRLEKLDGEIRQRDNQLEELNIQRTVLHKEVTSLKHILGDGRDELKDLQEQVNDAEDQTRTLEQDLRETHRQREEAKIEIERLNEEVRESRRKRDECAEEEQENQQRLANLSYDLEAKEAEYQEMRAHVSSANAELGLVQSNLASKQVEVTKLSHDLSRLKKDLEKRLITGEKLTEYEKQVTELRREVDERNGEKNELAYALTRSFEEVQKLRSDSSQEREHMNRERLQLEGMVRDLQQQLDLTQQELSQVQKRAENQVVELEMLAQEHFRRANRLNADLGTVNDGHSFSKHQEGISAIEPHGHTHNADELHQLQQQKDNIEQHLVVLRTNLEEVRNAPPTENKENEPVREITGPHREEWRREALKERLVQEQDYLRQQLRQQMTRHSEAMESVRMQSEGTLDSLRRKLNNLQDVLGNSGKPADIDKDLRSRSPGRSGQRSLSRSPDRKSILGDSRTKDISPTRSYSSQRPRSRSHSRDRLGSPMFPERDVVIS